MEYEKAKLFFLFATLIFFLCQQKELSAQSFCNLYTTQYPRFRNLLFYIEYKWTTRLEENDSSRVVQIALLHI